MGRLAIARCIVRAIKARDTDRPKHSLLRRILSWFAALFALWKVPLQRNKDETFSPLRESWSAPEDVFVRSFTSSDGDETSALEQMGTMGYSGSTFFQTKDNIYIVKSLPRYFEVSALLDLLPAYAAYLSAHPHSLLCRIYALLSSTNPALGLALGTAPGDHVVMSNLLYNAAHPSSNLSNPSSESHDTKWETFDLKPTSYFFPERDVAGGMLASEATKSRLADHYEGKILLSRKQARDFIHTLEEDTRVLAEGNAVDYSLFLIRREVAHRNEDPFADPPDASHGESDWQAGVTSADGKYMFRAAVLDFFWAKHKTQPRVLSFLVKTYNLAMNHGEMSITTTAEEYRERFLGMCRNLVEEVDMADAKRAIMK